MIFILMKKIAHIGSLVKKIHRQYNAELLETLLDQGFNDLRASFLEILLYISDHESPSIKEIGIACGLKKQTMTSHLNELERRGYIKRESSLADKREQLVLLTDYGKKLRLSIFSIVDEIEKKYLEKIGEVELDRIERMLENLLKGMKEDSQQGSLI